MAGHFRSTTTNDDTQTIFLSGCAAWIRESCAIPGTSVVSLVAGLGHPTRLRRTSPVGRARGPGQPSKIVRSEVSHSKGQGELLFWRDRPNTHGHSRIQSLLAPRRADSQLSGLCCPSGSTVVHVRTCVSRHKCLLDPGGNLTYFDRSDTLSRGAGT